MGGAYLIDADQASSANWYLGVPVGSADSTTLPVDVTFWPQWTPFDTGVPTDARLLALPLPPVSATVGNRQAASFISLDTVAYPPGGKPGDIPIEWIAALPPTTTYTGEVQVVSPFLDAYPDLSYVVDPVTTDDPSQSVSLGPGTVVVHAPPLPAPAITARRADGMPFEKGWSLYYRDKTSQQRLTSRVPVSGTSTLARLNFLNTVGASLPPDAQLVLQPPAGLIGVPTLASPSIIGTVETYPALPPLARVSGNVVSPTGAPVSAKLLFFSSLIDDVTSCAAGVHTSSTNLSYEAVAWTEDEQSKNGAVGAYTVDLPQGTYGVIVEPAMTSGYAKTVLSYLSIPADLGGDCSGPSFSTSLAPIVVVDPITVSGAFATADGRPLANAYVDFTPAAHLALQRRLGHDASSLVEDSWPRPFTTATGVAGDFTVSLDPGEYDITVRPEEGSGFAWTVEPDRLLSAPISLASLALPAPVVIDVRLHDSADNAIVGASVQAFSFFDGSALAIGEATTDAVGHMTLFLSTEFARN